MSRRPWSKAGPNDPALRDGKFEKLDVRVVSAERTIDWKDRTPKVTTVESQDAKGRKVVITASADTPPLGVVTLESDQMKMELMDWGTGAKTRMTGWPVGMRCWIWRVILKTFREGEAAPAEQPVAAPASGI